LNARSAEIKRDGSLKPDLSGGPGPYMLVSKAAAV
jgi:hypothetical protein